MRLPEYDPSFKLPRIRGSDPNWKANHFIGTGMFRNPTGSLLPASQVSSHPTNRVPWLVRLMTDHISEGVRPKAGSDSFCPTVVN